MTNDFATIGKFHRDLLLDENEGPRLLRPFVATIWISRLRGRLGSSSIDYYVGRRQLQLQLLLVLLVLLALLVRTVQLESARGETTAAADKRVRQSTKHNAAFRTQVHNAGLRRMAAKCKHPKAHSKRGLATHNAETGS